MSSLEARIERSLNLLHEYKAQRAEGIEAQTISSLVMMRVMNRLIETRDAACDEWIVEANSRELTIDPDEVAVFLVEVDRVLEDAATIDINFTSQVETPAQASQAAGTASEQA